MSDSPAKSLFSLHRSDGTVEHGLTAQELTARILDGSISEIDFLATQGGGPRPFWQFREFAPLAARVRKTGSSASLAQPSAANRPAIAVGPGSRITPALGQPSAVNPNQPSVASAPALASSGSLPAERRTSTNPRLAARPARLFADNLLKLRLPQFRARLLDTPLTEIVGAGLDDTPEAIAHAANARLEQLQEHFGPRLFAEEDAGALVQAKETVARAAAALALPDRREAVIARAEEIGRLPLFRELEALIPPIELANDLLLRLLPKGAKTPAVTGSHPTDSIIHALETGTAVRRNLSAPDHTARRGSEINIPAQRRASEANIPAHRPSSPRNTALDNDWGSGSFDAGARTAMGPLVGVWVAAVAAVLLTDWGRFEHQLGLLDPMNLVRLVLLVGATLAATLVLRREPLSRLGFAPEKGWHWALPAAGLLAGYLLSEIWSFSFDRTAGIGAIVMIAAIRALGEGLFFEGHVARTMFIEARTPIIGVLLSAGGSAAYMASFFDVLRSETPITPVIIGLWFLFIGVPAALSMWVSRSVWVPVGFRFFAIVALYLMQSGANG